MFGTSDLFYLRFNMFGLNLIQGITVNSPESEPKNGESKKGLEEVTLGYDKTLADKMILLFQRSKSHKFLNKIKRK